MSVYTTTGEPCTGCPKASDCNRFELACEAYRDWQISGEFDVDRPRIPTPEMFDYVFWPNDPRPRGRSFAYTAEETRERKNLRQTHHRKVAAVLPGVTV